MKKLVLTAVIVLSLVMGSYTQGYAQNNKNDGLFQRGATPEQQMRGADEGIFLPTHGINGNWNAEHEPSAPLGSGALLLMGFGAAYAMKKRKKKD